MSGIDKQIARSVSDGWQIGASVYRLRKFLDVYGDAIFTDAVADVLWATPATSARSRSPATSSAVTAIARCRHHGDSQPHPRTRPLQLIQSQYVSRPRRRRVVSRKVATRAPRQQARRAENRRLLPRLIDRLTVGQELSVSPFCLGMVPDWKLVPAAFEMGINFFFVSTDMHWSLYEASRRGLKALFASRKQIRDQVVIAGVCYPTQPEFMDMPFDELVNAVPGMTRVDVLVAGGSYGADILARAATLRRVAAAKHARAVGASFHDRQAALWATNYHLIDLCFLRYNPAHPGARYDFFPKLLTRHPPLYNFNSMRGFVDPEQLRSMKLDPSLWRPEATDYYRYALTHPQMTGLLFTVKQRRQLMELDAAMSKGPLTPVEEGHLEELQILARRSSSTKP